MKDRIGGFVIGVIIGTFLGSAGAAPAQGPGRPGYWQSSEAILRAGNSAPGELLQTGYIEAIDDTLSTMTSSPAFLVSGPVIDWMKKTRTCLESHMHGKVEEFVRWATAAWKSDVDAGYGWLNAAYSLTGQACK